MLHRKSYNTFSKKNYFYIFREETEKESKGNRCFSKNVVYVVGCVRGRCDVAGDG
jgi:hypothetical protein